MKSKIFLPQLMWHLAELDEDDVYTDYGTWDDSTETFGPDVQYKIIYNESKGHRRFTEEFDLVFLDMNENKYYHCTYERGLTEYRPQRPFEYETDGVKCNEVSVTREEIITYRTLWKYV
ncbi:hypothetical protein FOI42_RS03985 [Escherichia coli]|nr:hypothetical protein [Escherichia coli]MED6699471.1 hypothetical protein [Escherichia coli O157]